MLRTRVSTVAATAADDNDDVEAAEAAMGASSGCEARLESGRIVVALARSRQLRSFLHAAPKPLAANSDSQNKTKKSVWSRFRVCSNRGADFTRCAKKTVEKKNIGNRRVSKCLRAVATAAASSLLAAVGAHRLHSLWRRRLPMAATAAAAAAAARARNRARSVRTAATAKWGVWARAHAARRAPRVR